MEQIKLDEYYPLLSIKNNICLSNNGDIILCYALDLPEMFTVSKEDHININDFWYRTLKYLPENTFIHKQDIYTKKVYTGSDLPNKTFLQKAEINHYKDRVYYEHTSYLFIGTSAKSTLKATGLRNPFKTIPNKKKLLAEFNRDNTFISEVTKSIDFLNSSRYIKAHPIYEEEVDELIHNYYNGFDNSKYIDTDLEAKVKTDSQTFNAIGVGDKRVGIFTINDISQFPDYVTQYKLDTDYSTKKFQIFKGASDDFGFKLGFNHIYNQIIYIDDHSKHKEELETRKEHLQGASGFSTDNETAGEETEKYLKELSKDESKKIVRAHSNIIYYADTNKEFEHYTNLISTVYRGLDYKPHYPNRRSIKELYLKSLFPYVSRISNGNLYRTELQIALTSFVNVTSYKSDEEGILFSDRIFNIPIKRNVRDANKKRIKAWNFAVYGPTGEGKSVLMQHIARQSIEDGKRFIAFDIGGSFKTFSYLFPKEECIFISYEPGKPLPLNAFYIKDINGLTITKKSSLASFVFGLWKPEENITNEYKTPLVKLIESYYMNVSDNHSFPHFYNFIKANSKTILQSLSIEDRFFDIEDFLLHCGTYVTGEYSFLFQNTEDESYLIEDKSVIIFEFEKAQENLLLLNILTQIGNEAVEKLILDDRSIDGVVFYDEYAKFVKNQKIKHKVTYYHQTIRKHNGSVGTALQTPNQLPKGEDTDAMIENTQVFYILFNEKGYQPIVNTLNLSEHHHNVLKSITPNLKAKTNKFNEFALMIGKEIWVMRLELSKEAYYVYQTEGKVYTDISKLVKKNNYNIEKSILEYINLN